MTGLARPSVRPSVCPVQAPNSKTKRRRQTQIGVNVPHEKGEPPQCYSLQLKSSNVRVRVAQL